VLTWPPLPLHSTHFSLAQSQNLSIFCKICCGGHKRCNSTSSLQHCGSFNRLTQLIFDYSFNSHVATRSLYSNTQRNVNSPPSIPPSSMPALVVAGFESDTHANPGPPRPPMSNPKPTRPTPRLRSKKSEPPSRIDDQLLKAFCDAEPASLEAEDLIHAVLEGESDLFKIPRRRQITLMYKVFQHCWLESLSELLFLYAFWFVNFSIITMCQSLSIRERRLQSLDSV
jgi:hypothetical protein